MNPKGGGGGGGGGGGLFHVGSGRRVANEAVSRTGKSSPLLEGTHANGIAMTRRRRRTRGSVAYRVVRAKKASSSSNANANNETSVVSIDAPGWRGYGTGGRIWSSSKVLREFLKENGDAFVLDKNVVELGCGTGVVGIYAAKRGQARNVLLTDGGSDALLKLAEENASKNGVENISVHKLEWGVGKVSPTLRDCMKTNPPDLIVGSDCTYERKSHAALCDIRNKAISPHKYLVSVSPCFSRPHYSTSHGWTGILETFIVESVFVCQPVFHYESSIHSKRHHPKTK